jgi:hypothetical protein
MRRPPCKPLHRGTCASSMIRSRLPIVSSCRPPFPKPGCLRAFPALASELTQSPACHLPQHGYVWPRSPDHTRSAVGGEQRVVRHFAGVRALAGAGIRVPGGFTRRTRCQLAEAVATSAQPELTNDPVTLMSFVPQSANGTFPRAARGSRLRSPRHRMRMHQRTHSGRSGLHGSRWSRCR